MHGNTNMFGLSRVSKIGRKPNWINKLEKSGGKHHEGSGICVWPNGMTSRPKTSSSNGYITVRGLNGKIWLLHRIIAECFVPNPDNKPIVNHIDGNKGNPRADNLEWVTNQENCLHAYRTGLNYYRPKVKFTRRQILYIRRSETPLHKLAKKYRVSYSVIYNVHYLKTHKNV
jgi:HNH endonuclease